MRAGDALPLRVLHLRMEGLPPLAEVTRTARREVRGAGVVYLETTMAAFPPDRFET